MASLSRKSALLLSVMLLISIGLQAGGIKLMINLNQPDEQAAEIASVDHAESPTPAAKPEITVTDPPSLAGLNKPSAPAHSPESTLDAENHSSPPATESALPSMPMSTIPPPIELEPDESVETPTDAAAEKPLTESVEVAALASRFPPPIELEGASGKVLEPSWVQARDPDHYTVQLYSGKDLDRLRERAGSQPVTDAGPQAYYVTPSRSGPWYSLVVGDYPDFNAAQTIATQIAAESENIKPWIRRFSEIQARMR